MKNLPPFAGHLFVLSHLQVEVLPVPVVYFLLIKTPAKNEENKSQCFKINVLIHWLSTILFTEKNSFLEIAST